MCNFYAEDIFKGSGLVESKKGLLTKRNRFDFFSGRRRHLSKLDVDGNSSVAATKGQKKKSRWR